jgi:hypothetical protein
VLFEGEAAAELMAQVLADTVRLQRRPFAAPGTDTPAMPESVWASRIGSKVMPDWISLVDDPQQKTFQGSTLAGQYDFDDEGVPGERVAIVDHGILKNFLLSRTPVRTFHTSNGHGRLPSGLGGSTSAIGNLFVQVNGGLPEKDLRTQLLRRVNRSGLKYGIVIRRIDFPFSGDMEELQSLGQQMQKGGFVRTVSPPLLAYRVYPDGREELRRGLRFREFSAKDLRDVSAASNRSYVFNYVNNGSSWNVADTGSNAVTSSVICPSLLFEGVDLARAENEAGKLPLVPSPPVTGVSAGDVH